MGYWSAHSLPPRRDGVFRAAPAAAAQGGDRVVAQCGAWSALVSLGGELFQAFFDSHEAAAAALQAALQSEGGAAPAARGRGGRRSSSEGAQGAAAEQADAGSGSPAAAEATEGADSALAADGLSLGAHAAEMSSPSQAAVSTATDPPHGETAGPPAGAAQGPQQPLVAAAEPGPNKRVHAQQA